MSLDLLDQLSLRRELAQTAPGQGAQADVHGTNHNIGARLHLRATTLRPPPQAVQQCEEDELSWAAALLCPKVLDEAKTAVLEVKEPVLRPPLRHRACTEDI
ncbi:hypothetical protein TEQG_03858 [Trichophyton equinum CBS 127.97]|uniref:Uncharacterized protein n=1 Tax=Trichophyton equinum (strain ATCC MYA-4606 / CBS 127.97) TaxID=559882 RepID=F2PSZ8_TRIEC|nr:hypothetical protein TEQG_03858 [Trichophyton equinum CBS 127.97]